MGWNQGFQVTKDSATAQEAVEIIRAVAAIRWGILRNQHFI
jgi:hypothetical protein